MNGFNIGDKVFIKSTVEFKTKTLGLIEKESLDDENLAERIYKIKQSDKI